MTPRGIRLNNPGNIRHNKNITWVGQATEQLDPDFVTFISPEYGFRAMVRILHSYEREGVTTLGQAIDHWAPPSENNTGSYVADVCERCSVQPTDTVDFNDIMPALLKAITQHEQGEQPYGDDVIVKGISLA